MTAPKCRDCDRPISSRESVARQRGSQCHRDHLAALGIRLAKTLRRGRRNWAPDMPGQELLDLEAGAEW